MSEPNYLWKKLIRWIKQGSLIPIVGPDLLVVEIGGREMPLYRYLAEQLAANHGIDLAEIPGQHTLSRVAVRMGRSNAEAVIADLLEKVQIPVPKPLVQLARIAPLQLFVTTTFDPYLVRALDQIRKKPANSWRYAPDIHDSFSDLPERALGDDRPHVFHLFGNVRDGGSFVITEGDTVDFMAALLSRQGSVPLNLLRRLKDSNLLLLGIQFHDWLARFFIRFTSDLPYSVGHKTEELFADDEVLVDEDLQQFFLLFREGRTHIYQAGSSHCPGCTAVQFVEALAAAWEKEQPAQISAAPARAQISEIGLEHGAIFISYERSEMRAALNVAQRLQASGLRYWLDKQNIKGGQDWERKIRDGIHNCAVFMPLISSSAINKASGYVFEEWQMAVALRNRNPDREFIIPVVIDEGAHLPDIFSHLHGEQFTNGELSDHFLGRLRVLQEKFLTS